MPNPTHKLIVLENGVLASLAANSNYLREFPFLRRLATSGFNNKGCRSCARSNQATADAYMSAKLSIAGLASDRKALLKTMLSTRQARVTYRRPDGKMIMLTF